MRVISFTDQRPAPRFDGNPWTDARIEVSDDGNEWAEVETVELKVDDDPSKPALRSFTVTLDAAGPWFRVVYIDAVDNEDPGDPFTVPSNIALRPTVTEVAAVLHARTYVDGEDVVGGDEAGTFNTDTRPTAAQVEILITQAAGDATMRIGQIVPPEFHESAKQLIATRAANLIELAYFPEQSIDGRTVYQSLRLTYEEGVKALAKNLELALYAERGLL